MNVSTNTTQEDRTMPRIQALNPDTATGSAKVLLDGVQAKLGFTPNLMKTMANSPAVLKAYLGFSSALATGALSDKLREQIALTVAQTNECDYCLAAHSAIGKTVGLNDETINDSRQALSPDSKDAAALQFARKLVTERGWVNDEDLSRLRQVGFGDREISEIVANVAFNLFSNYFNHVAETEVDFPSVPQLSEV